MLLELNKNKKSISDEEPLFIVKNSVTMQNHCIKKCPYKKLFAVHYSPFAGIMGCEHIYFCERGKCSTQYLDRVDFPEHIGLAEDNKGRQLRHEYCIEYFGDGMSNKEKIIKFLKKSPYHILKNRIRSLRWKIQYRLFPKKQTDEEHNLAFDNGYEAMNLRRTGKI
jgi:hypothetical protein